jgi:hypothetical protein
MTLALSPAFERWLKRASPDELRVRLAQQRMNLGARRNVPHSKAAIAAIEAEFAIRPLEQFMREHLSDAGTSSNPPPAPTSSDASDDFDAWLASATHADLEARRHELQSMIGTEITHPALIHCGRVMCAAIAVELRARRTELALLRLQTATRRDLPADRALSS